MSLKGACDLRASSNDVAGIPIFPFSVKFTFSHLIVRGILSLYYEDSYARWSIMEGTIIALMKQILSCSLIGLTSLTPTNNREVSVEINKGGRRSIDNVR